jgi:hypothetical protein
MGIKLKGRIISGPGSENCCPDYDINKIQPGHHIKVILYDPDAPKAAKKYESCYLTVLNISDVTEEVNNELQELLKDYSENFHQTVLDHAPVGPEKYECIFDSPTSRFVIESTDESKDSVPLFPKGHKITVKRSCIWGAIHSHY